MSYKPKSCACQVPCLCCAGDDHPEAIKLHNLRCACHGERAYPRPETVSRDPFANWERDVWAARF